MHEKTQRNPNGSGAKTKCTPKLQKKFIELARKGLPIITICQLCRINKNTWLNWSREAEEGREPFASFVAKVEEARAADAAEMLATVQEHIKLRKDPKYGLKYMDVLHEIQSKQQTKKVEVSNTHQLMPAFDTDKLSDEEFAQWCALVDKMKPQGKVLAVESTEGTLIEAAPVKEPTENLKP